MTTTTMVNSKNKKMGKCPMFITNWTLDNNQSHVFHCIQIISFDSDMHTIDHHGHFIISFHNSFCKTMIMITKFSPSIHPSINQLIAINIKSMTIGTFCRDENNNTLVSLFCSLELKKNKKGNKEKPFIPPPPQPLTNKQKSWSINRMDCHSHL